MAKLREVDNQGNQMDPENATFGGWRGIDAMQQAPPMAPDSGPVSGPGEPQPGNPTPPREGGYNVPLRPLSGGQATAPQPMVPTPHEAAVSPQAPMPGGMDPAGLASPQRRSLFGGAGGLTEGGFGVPGNSANQGPDQISALIQQLLMNRGS